jgi:BMFP domain-containing protein YqiC
MMSDFPDGTRRQPPTVPVRRYVDAGVTRTGAERMNASMKIDLAHIDELARRLSSLVPTGLREGRDELQQNFKSVLQTGLGKLDLVTRDEFDVQRAVLLRTRDKLNELQRAIAQIEAQLASSPPQH